MNVNQKRDIVLVGHAHSGKTTLAESMLFLCGATSRKGDVMQGSSISDYNDDERDRKISINASFLNATFKDHGLQIIDTPGYLDFIGETVSSLKVSDGAVIVVDAVSGVEVGTEDVWQRLDSLQIPRLIFINKIDKEGADLTETINTIKDQLSTRAVLLNLDSSDFIEAVAESDDQLLEKYLDKGSLSREEVEGAVRKAVLERKLFPILTGSASSDKGVKELLDAIMAYLPSPLDHMPFKVKDPVNHTEKEIESSSDGPFAGFVFKSMFDPHLGHLSLMRVLRGTLNSNSDFINANNSTKEHIGGITILQGKDQVTVSQARCGDIVALPKLKNTHVSDCLCDAKEKISLDPIEFPEPSISASIKPKTREDEEKISSSLHRLCEEDHTFQVKRDEETKELIVSGVGDLHLKILMDRMKSRYHVDVEVGKPKVSYREAISKTARARYKYKKQSGGRGQYGDVELEVSPLPKDGLDYEFLNKIFGGAIPRNFVPSIEKGVVKVLKEGVLAGYPLTHVQVKVIDGSYHDVDSSDMAFQIAGALAMKDALKSAGLMLLEPIMDVTIVVPADFIGPISGDISGRRGRILGAEGRGKKEVVKALIPLNEMFSYATDLRSMTQGRGSYSMKMSHYEHAPAKVTDMVTAERQKQTA
ncbi:MAG: elongation factor G, partial [Candidatus Omnitrophica bacterium]|nr:elongation factor G [Candidatus Omnitrophota bacterium]